MFYYSSCSNNSSENSWQENQENKNPGIVKQDTTAPPQITILENLADSSKPKEFFLEKRPKPQAITIPKVAGASSAVKTNRGYKKKELAPSNHTQLYVLKNKKGEVIKGKDGKPFILDDAGGYSNFTHYTTDQGLALDAIACGFRDKTGNLWFGTLGGGVSRYDGKSFTNFTSAQGLPNYSVMSITEDGHQLGTDGARMSGGGNLWFGTDGGGVSRYDGKYFTNFTTAEGLANNKVFSVMGDKTGNIWFGTSGGVSRYDPSAKLRTGSESFTNFTTAQGLANNNVYSITEDKMGNLWFGTFGGGVSRYDGNRANHPCNKNTCKHNLRIQQDLKEHNNELAKSFTNFTTAQGLANNTVLSIAEDKMGNLWFGTSGGGVSRYNGNRVEAIEASLQRGEIMPQETQQDLKKINGKFVKSFTNFTTEQGLANNVVRSITEDKSGNIWFGTNGGGVSLYDGRQTSSAGMSGTLGEFTNFTTGQGLANNNIWSITEDKSGNIWFGTYGAGVSRYDGKSFTNFNTEHGLADNSVWSIAEDKMGNLWFGTFGFGVSRYDGKHFTSFTTENGLANNTVWSIAEDKMGNLWFGTFGGGVCRYDGKHFTNYTAAQGLANNNVLSITEVKTGNLWFGTSEGVSRYDGNRVEAIEASLQRGEIIPQGTQQGLKKINGKFVKCFTNYTSAQGLANNKVGCITEDKAGNLWFSTRGAGVSRYDGNRVDAIEAALQRGEIIPERTQQDLKRENGKLVKSFTNYTTAQGLANNTVRGITEDKMGNLWFSTDGGGISRYDGKSFTNYTTAQGLPDNTVLQITITKEQNIVIGTNYGLAVITGFSPLSSSELAGADAIPVQNNLTNEALKNYTPVIEIYNSANGYPVKDVNAGQNTILLDSKGILWIATGADKTALVRFDYAALNKNKLPPDVVIQSVKINNENICWYNLENSKFKVQSSKLEKTDSTTMPANITEEVTTLGKVLNDKDRNTMRQKFKEIKFDGITKFYPIPINLILPHGNNNITFDFAAIEPAKPFLVRYQYILEGYDNDWSPVTNKTTATFGNIYEGTYTFKLKAQSPFGVWSEPITYTFKVLPPWWRTWWMYCMYSITAIALIVLIVWWNGKRLRANATELKKEVLKATTVIREEKEKVELANVEISEQKEIAELANIEISKQKEIVEKQKEKIIDSITYAQLIQQSILMEESEIQNYLPDSFIYFQPKDIVSGDFYWCNKIDDKIILAVVDCTGHGVPGAFMSMVGNTLLNQIVNEKRITTPSEILRLLNLGVCELLHQTKNRTLSRDGMDIALCCIDSKNNTLQYAGAHNPLYILSDNNIEIIKADIHGIGGAGMIRELLDPLKKEFTNHVIPLKKGISIYLFTDGYWDQFGGKDRKKFGKIKFNELILSNQHLSMQKQKEHFAAAHTEWKGNTTQIDDILVIGVKL